MKFGETKLLKEKHNVRLLEVGCRYDKVAYCVIGHGNTRHYDDYEDAMSVVDLINSLTDYIEEVKEYVDPRNIIIKADYNKDLWGSGILNDIATVNLFSDNEIEE